MPGSPSGTASGLVGGGLGLGDSLSSPDPFSIGEGTGAIVSPVRERSVEWG